MVEARSDEARAATGLLRALIETTKPGITRMVALTAAVGFALAAIQRWHVGEVGPVWSAAVAFVATVAGTALAAGGANALNQWMERQADARMQRTQRRPLPMARVSPAAVGRFGAALVAAGVALLWALTGVAPALLALASAVVYVAAYTPSKPHTAWSTVIGTAPGALPALIGWTGAGQEFGVLDAGGQALLWLMVAWQLPHFYALAWVYREDYARGGMRVLAVVDPTGARTRWAVLVTAVGFAVAALAPVAAMPEVLGWGYAACALAAGALVTTLAARFFAEVSVARARAVFVSTLVVLPMLFVALVADAALG